MGIISIGEGEPLTSNATFAPRIAFSLRCTQALPQLRWPSWAVPATAARAVFSPPVRVLPPAPFQEYFYAEQHLPRVTAAGAPRHACWRSSRRGEDAVFSRARWVQRCASAGSPRTHQPSPICCRLARPRSRIPPLPGTYLPPVGPPLTSSRDAVRSLVADGCTVITLKVLPMASGGGMAPRGRAGVERAARAPMLFKQIRCRGGLPRVGETAARAAAAQPRGCRLPAGRSRRRASAWLPLRQASGGGGRERERERCVMAACMGRCT